MPITKQDVLDYHRQGRAGKIEVRATKPLATQQDLSLAYSPGVAYPCLDIEADPSQIEQVIVNLLVNAREAMPTGGTLPGPDGRVQKIDKNDERLPGRPAALPEMPCGPCFQKLRTPPEVFERDKPIFEYVLRIRRRDHALARGERGRGDRREPLHRARRVGDHPARVCRCPAGHHPGVGGPR